MEMNLSWIDWTIIAGIFLLTTSIGLCGSKQAGKSKADYFVGGRAMPWWLLGFSMVATTFSSDTPNLVANLVRDHGVCGNWLWWSLLPSGMLTVFLYARLWRRSGIITDLEYYELRYSGRTATFLRGFRAAYLGFFFNVFMLAGATLSAIKIGGAMLNLTPVQSVLGAMIITALFSSAAGLRGVLFSDMFLFIIAMVGAVAAAYFAVTRPEVGGLSGLVAKFSASPELLKRTEVFGFTSYADWVSLFIIPLTIIWWSVWYPGAEPGGGGFLVQRMLAAKNEKHAAGATLFFNAVHYAVRPWPWILVALASLIVYPDRAALIQALKGVLPENQIHGDAAYSLMLKDMPVGWIGLMAASLFAAYVSTMSTLLNWGSSYIVHDFYSRFIRPNATEKEQVNAGRLATVFLMVLAGFISLIMTSAMDLFNIVLSVGAGTGLLFMLRWFWWRVNAAAELTAMIASFIFSMYFTLLHDRIFPALVMTDSEKMVAGIVLTTAAWLLACFFGPQNDKSHLYDFCRKINPAGPGWNKVRRDAASDGVDVDNPTCPRQPLWCGIVASVFGCLAIYAVLFGVGELIFSHCRRGMILLLSALPSGLLTWYFGVRLADNRKKESGDK